MDTKQVLGRFEAERQALALMDHPHIAKVLDAGATASGGHYFVMELVRGIPATRYCDENKLNTRQRLELFIKICQAVQHAHQKGIIHRDLKPSNLLVADHDGVPVPKVIDFGIAKATTGQDLTTKTVFTGFEQFMGTPAYMSPEQAKISGLDIDTRSDGRTITVVEALGRAVTRLDHDLADQPGVRAQLQTSLGQTYFGLGLYPEAISLQEQVRDYDLKTFGLEQANTISAMDNLAWSYEPVGRKAEALKLHEEVLALCRQVLGPKHPQTLTAMNHLAEAYADAGRAEEALTLREELLPLLRNGPSPDPDLLAVMTDLAFALATSDPAASWSATNVVQLAAAAVAGTSRKNPEYLDTLAAACAQTQQFDQAQAVEQEAMGLLKTEVEKLDYATRLKLYQAHRPYREPKKP